MSFILKLIKEHKDYHRSVVANMFYVSDVKHIFSYNKFILLKVGATTRWDDTYAQSGFSFHSIPGWPKTNFLARFNVSCSFSSMCSFEANQKHVNLSLFNNFIMS